MLKKFLRAIKKRRMLLVILILIGGGAVATAFLWGRNASANDYITAKIEKTTVEVKVSATGTVQAVTTVQVGSQVSGTVSFLGADFNAEVKKNQVVARLD